MSKNRSAPAKSTISSNFLVISRFVPRPALDPALGPAGEIGRPGPHRHGGVDSRAAADSGPQPEKIPTLVYKPLARHVCQASEGDDETSRILPPDRRIMNVARGER